MNFALTRPNVRKDTQRRRQVGGCKKVLLVHRQAVAVVTLPQLISLRESHAVPARKINTFRRLSAPPHPRNRETAEIVELRHRRGCLRLNRTHQVIDECVFAKDNINYKGSLNVVEDTAVTERAKF